MKRAALVALLIASGCTASVSGEPLGKPFGSANAVAQRSSNSISSTYTVTISNREIDCGALRSDAPPRAEGTQLLQVIIARNGNALPLSRPEPYLSSGGEEFSAVYACEAAGGTCRPQVLGTSSVTLTNATDARVAGGFEVTFGSDQKFSGSFDAALCP